VADPCDLPFAANGPIVNSQPYRNAEEHLRKHSVKIPA
jgi:hypothetical protein